MSSIDRGQRIEDGQIDYGRVFVTFTKHTEQKITHGLILEALLQALQERGVVLKDEEPTTLVDLGCGEGHTAVEMLGAINRVHPRGAGINYYGFDADNRFVRSARRLLQDAKDRQRIGVINVQQANVFGGDPWPLGPIDDVFVTLGHLLYYARRPGGVGETRRCIAAIIDRVLGLLGQDGICLLAHSATNCTLATLRASVTDSVEARPTRVVADVAEQRRLDLMSLLVPYQINFPRLTPKQWDQTKEPAAHRVESSDNVEFRTTLDLLMFIAQRSLQSLAQEQQLEGCVDEVQAQLDGDAVLHAVSEYQLLLSPHQSPTLKTSVEAAVQQVKQSLDQIVHRARRQYALQSKESGSRQCSAFNQPPPF